MQTARNEVEEEVESTEPLVSAPLTFHHHQDVKLRQFSNLESVVAHVGKTFSRDSFQCNTENLSQSIVALLGLGSCLSDITTDFLLLFSFWQGTGYLRNVYDQNHASVQSNRTTDTYDEVGICELQKITEIKTRHLNKSSISQDWYEDETVVEFQFSCFEKNLVFAVLTYLMICLPGAILTSWLVMFIKRKRTKLAMLLCLPVFMLLSPVLLVCGKLLRAIIYLNG